MSLTVPQIIMLNHAAWVDSRESDLRSKAREAGDRKKEQRDKIDPTIDEFGGMRLSELEKDEKKLDLYLKDWSSFG